MTATGNQRGAVQGTCANGQHQQARSFFLLFFVVFFTTAAVSQPQHQRLLFSHPLTGSQSDQGLIIKNTDGTFSSRGWQSKSATSQLCITLPRALEMEGTFSVRVTNFDPYNQNLDLKQPIIDLYSCACGNKDIYETDGAWFHLITGRHYTSGTPGEAGFKLWAAPRGVGSKDEEQFMQNARWDPALSYEFKFIWSGTRLYFLVDGTVRMQLPFAGQVKPFRYIFLGKDHLIWGYTAQPGPIFYDLRLYAPGAPAGGAGPKLLAVEALARDLVEAVFDRPLDPLTTVQPGHFSITPGLAISGTALRGDGSKVWLTTAPHQTNTTYRLRVQSILDTSVPPDTSKVDSLAYRFTDAAVTGISRAGYRVITARTVGDSVYSDRDYRFSDIPGFAGAYHWILTANDDKGNNDAAFLQFYAAKPLRVVVGLDISGEPVPGWTQDWLPRSERIVTKDTGFRLLEKTFEPGPVTLGGNGMSPSSSMYLVMFQAKAPTGVDAPPAPPTGVRVIQTY